MKTINIGIFGFGFMGKVYANAAENIKHFYPDSPSVNVSAILVSNKKTKNKIKSIKSRYGVDYVTKNIDDILNDINIDAVYIGTPNNFHYEQVLKVINSGKHVLCDKPMAVTSKESKKMLETSKQNPAIIANMVFEYRFVPAINSIKKLITSGKLGDIIQFRAFYLHGSYIDERPITWRLRKGTGGVLVDLGPHVFDLINYLIGTISISNYKKTTKIPNRDVDDIAWILCKAKNADGLIEVSRVSTGSLDELRLEIHGSKGSVKWNLEELNYFEYFSKDSDFTGYKKIPSFTNELDNSDFPPPKVSSGWLMAHTHCLYSFVKEISDKKFNNQINAKFIDGHSVQQVLEKMNNNGN